MVARKFLTSDDLAAREEDDDEEFFNQILIEGARADHGYARRLANRAIVGKGHGRSLQIHLRPHRPISAPRWPRQGVPSAATPLQRVG